MSLPLTELTAALEARFTYERIALVPKAESPLNRLIDRCLRLLTFGQQRDYQRAVVTTLGRRIYLPSCWPHVGPAERYLILRHEYIHIRQFRFFRWPGMAFLYVLLPLPFGFAPGRTWLEWQAYRETIRATYALFGRTRAEALEPELIRRFTGPDYAWMWCRKRSIQRWFHRYMAALDADPPSPETLLNEDLQALTHPPRHRPASG